ncbi:unnamed protein product, partial [Ectocarpus fasciculatus]
MGWQSRREGGPQTSLRVFFLIQACCSCSFYAGRLPRTRTFDGAPLSACCHCTFLNLCTRAVLSFVFLARARILFFCFFLFSCLVTIPHSQQMRFVEYVVEQVP